MSLGNHNSSTYDKHQQLWHGPKSRIPLFHPDCSVGRILHQMMQLKPNAVALNFDPDGTTITYEKLLLDSVRVAQHLKALSLGQDDIVGIVAGHVPMTTTVVLGCLFNATVFHPVNPGHEQAVVEHIFGITRPKVIFCEGQYYDKVAATNRNLKLNASIYTLNGHIEGVTTAEELLKPTGNEDSYEPEDLQRGEAQTMCILNSSGTSGLPKAVCLSNNVMVPDFMNFRQDSVTFVFSPLDWVTAIMFTVCTLMVGAKRVITTIPYTPEYLADLIEKHGITHIMMTPPNIARFVYMDGIEGRDLSSLRNVFVGGSKISPTVMANLVKLLPDVKNQYVGVGYGSTEIGGPIAMHTNMAKPASSGRLAAGLKVRIVDDEGKSLGIGELGEILIYSGKSWNGYYGNPEETRNMRDDDNWFHTGDLGYFDQDGDLFVVDRKKDIMKFRGVHYSPHEIEEAIEQIPDVLEVCVFGNTNETDGDRAAAAVVKRAGSPLTEEQVVQHVAGVFEVEWKRLHGGVFFMESLPKTGTGKINRRNVRDIIMSRMEKECVDH